MFTFHDCSITSLSHFSKGFIHLHFQAQLLLYKKKGGGERRLNIYTFIYSRRIMQFHNKPILKNTESGKVGIFSQILFVFGNSASSAVRGPCGALAPTRTWGASCCQDHSHQELRFTHYMSPIHHEWGPQHVQSCPRQIWGSRKAAVANRSILGAQENLGPTRSSNQAS